MDSTFQAERVRISILSSYWVVIFLALPLWWYTTSIERLSLPTSHVFTLAQEHLLFTINLELKAGPHIDDFALFSRRFQTELYQRRSQNPQRWDGLDVDVMNAPPNELDSKIAPGNYTLELGNEVSVSSRSISFKKDTTPSRLADALTSLLTSHSGSPNHEYRVAQFSPRFRLAFTLLNENAAAGNYFSDWDITEAINLQLSPVLDKLSKLHEFTIESQVQYHAPLAFSPRIMENYSGLTPEDLTIFINSAEWTLSSSVSNDPVLHFVLFVPSAARKPLFILNADGTPSSSNAFLLPQWGGVVILNPSPQTDIPAELSFSDLSPVFSTFSAQLLTLLGVPDLPAEISISKSTSIITEWQLDALLRRRTLENTRNSLETLQSIVKLVDQIQNMPVHQSVIDDVQDALTAIGMVYEYAHTSPLLAFNQSSQAQTLSSRAFFNPGMLALLYFPAEHKYAVYTPLFASALTPLVVAALRELKAWRNRRRA